MSEEIEAKPALKKLEPGSADDIRQKTGIQDLLYIVAYAIDINTDPVVLMANNAYEDDDIVCGKRKAKHFVDSGYCEPGFEPVGMARTCRWVNVGGTPRWVCA